MATITRKSETTVATVTSAVRKITVNVEKSLTVEESKELRKLLKAEEAKAQKQSGTVFGGLLSDAYFGGKSFTYNIT